MQRDKIFKKYGNRKYRNHTKEKYIPQSKKKEVKYLESDCHNLGDTVKSRYFELKRTGTILGN